MNIKSLGKYVKTGNPHEVRYNCPKCNDKKFHLYYNRVKHTFICFKCSYKGRISKENIEDVKDVSFYNEVIGRLNGKSITQECRLPEEFRLLSKNKDGRQERIAKKYLEQRGVSSNMSRAYKIGLCKTGLYGSRIILPIYNQQKLLYFIGRSFCKGVEPKYLNSTTPKIGIIFKTYKGIKPRVIVVEGIFDAISIGRVFPAIATLGKNVDSQQVFEIAKNCKSALICLDADAHKQGFELQGKLSGLIPCSALFLQNREKDPGNMSIKEIEQTIGGSKEWQRLPH